MHKTVDNYSLIKLLEKDSFGVQSFECQHKVLKKRFILKKLDYPVHINSNQAQSLEDKKENYFFECFLNQINVSKQLKTNRTLKCQKILKAKHALYVVYNPHFSMSLEKMLETEFFLIQKKQHIAKELIQLIKQLHRENCIIGNLSPNNIYISEEDKDRILLFNLMLAQCASGSSNKHVENKYLCPSDIQAQYYAPEVNKYGIVSKNSDIFSLGIFLSKMFKEQSMKKLLDSMIDKNFQKRPSIQNVQKDFMDIIKKLNPQTKSSTTKQSGQTSKLKGLISCKSLTFQKFGLPKSQKSMIEKKQSLVIQTKQTLPLKGSNIKVKSRFSQNVNQLKNSSTQKHLHLQPSQKYLNILQSKTSSKLISSRQSANRQQLKTSKVNQDSQNSIKSNIKQIFKTRNLATFIQQMSLFCYQNEQAELGFLLFKKAYILNKNCYQLSLWNIKKCENEAIQKLKQFGSMLKQQVQKFQLIYDAYIKKLKQTQMNIDIQIEGYKKNIFNEQLLQQKIKAFAYKILKSYGSQRSSDDNNQQKSGRHSNKKLKQERPKQSKIFDNDQKIFNVLMLVKKVQYGTFENFFKKKIHKQEGKFWNKSSFKVQKTFGKDYSLYQIKSILSLKK